MAKQLNLLSGGQVITTALHTEMQQSYLEYAMSVIVGRALPDVRDGLKPVHRRILYAMHELGLTPDRPYRKCARVVGDVLGKYHPHGDQAVYDALVRLVQEFSSRYPLLSGHGNFGSVDNDPPAAMRYTETRLSSISHEGMLSEIGEETVEFAPNFDNSQQEPTVLPAQLPFLLLNGCAGIAVGMATNVPPHNLGEVVDGLIALIDNPDLSEEKLFKIIPAPDFPTGGEIVGKKGIAEAYKTGRGSIVLRGIAQVEQVPGSRGNKKRTAIVVTELPYQVNKAGWIEKVADLVNQGKLHGIADIRDESDREGMRVVVELRRDANPEEVLYRLYHQTALQSNFGIILLAIVDGQPRQLSIRQLLEEFLKFREQTLNRRYSHELDKAQSRLHLVSGLLKALSNLDEVINILRSAADGSTAKVNLINTFEMSEEQADAILSMPLRRLTSLEQKNLHQESEELQEKITKLSLLLNDRRELLKALKKDFRALKRKFSNPRRTKLVEGVVNKGTGKHNSGNVTQGSKGQFVSAKFTPAPKEVILEFTHRGYVRKLANTGKKTKLDSILPDNDFLTKSVLTQTDKDLLVTTNSGKVYPVKVTDIPASNGRNARGTPLITVMSSAAQAAQEAVIYPFLLSEYSENGQIVLLTKQGRIKRLALNDFASITRRGVTIAKLKEYDELIHIQQASVGEQLVLASSGGRLLRFEVNDEQLPITGRSAMGLQGLRIGKQHHMVGLVNLRANENLLLVTENGYAKRITPNKIKLGNRGDLGAQTIKFAAAKDNLAGITKAIADSEVAIITNHQRVLRLSIDAVPLMRKDDKGEDIVKLNRDEKVISVTNVGTSVNS
ncbi:MAG: DNA gyrase subunit A [Cyanobacteria bacterium P01_A01_bin.45]